MQALTADPPVVRFHKGHDPVSASGDLRVMWGTSEIARLAARLLPIPRPGTKPVSIDIRRNEDGTERWIRRFGDEVFESDHLREGDFHTEFWGPAVICYEMVANSDGVEYVQLSFGLKLGRLVIPLPLKIAPKVVASATGRGGDSFFVSVAVSLPMIGTVLHYDGIAREGSRPQ